LRYDLTKRHGTGPFGGRFFGQCDLPRLREAKIGGAIWSITTQPFLPASLRASHLRKNFRRLTGIFSKVPAEAELCRNRSDYDRAKAKGAHAVWIGIQGGNAVGKNFETIDEIGDGLLRVTLVHLSRSNLGNTSSPLAVG